MVWSACERPANFVAKDLLALVSDEGHNAVNDLLLEAAEANDRTSRVIEVLLLQALVHQAQGATRQAIITLEQALTHAEPEGFVRTFVDEGPPMARLLYEAVKRGITPDYAQRLLAAFPNWTLINTQSRVVGNF